MKTTKVKCAECGKDFLKSLKEYKRCVKHGMRHFCSRSCSVTRGNKEMSKQKRIELGNRIKKFAGNRRDEYSPFKEYIRRIKTKERIKSYGQPDIDLNYLKEMWNTQQGICPYSKIKMILPNNINEYSKIHSLKKASLDRIDSSKGYIKENVEFVCSGINLAKNSFTRKEMKQFLSEINPM